MVIKDKWCVTHQRFTAWESFTNKCIPCMIEKKDKEIELKKNEQRRRKMSSIC
jgi:hypothetical protein